ncbi:MAG: HD domain-containing protein [Myxococcales bacterium]|nr:HD domain-containing protein [Myxococcales bacterium]
MKGRHKIYYSKAIGAAGPVNVDAISRYQEYAAHHARGTAQWAIRIARGLGLTTEEIESARVAAYFHDVGKLAIDGEILAKPGRLSPAEWALLKRHPQLGARLFEELPGYETVADGIRYHHECWDGSGYPAGLRGEEIPLAARIVAVADAFHAMTSHRAYAHALSAPDALAILRSEGGRLRDPAVVQVLAEELAEEEPAAEGDRRAA